MLLPLYKKIKKILKIKKRSATEDVQVKSKENIFVQYKNVKNHMEHKVLFYNIWN